MADTIKLRRGTAAQWATANPVLADGEPGYDETNDQIRIGNGSSAWSGLDPLDSPGGPVVVVDLTDPQFGVVGDGVTDDAAAIQAAIDSLSNARGIVQCGMGTYLCNSSLDAHRAHLRGIGVPGNSGGGGTVIHFTGTAGIFSSIEDNFGFAVSDLDLLGNGQSESGQILLNMIGQNNPRAWNARVRSSHYGFLLSGGAVVESHYSAFWKIDIQQCIVGLRITGGGDSNSHHFYGGRQWSCNTGTLIEDGVNNVSFTGVAFECGTDHIAVDSTGDNVTFNACRFETAGTNLLVRTGASYHYVFGCHHSSGLDLLDENDPSVVYGISTIANDTPRISRPFETTGNTVVNGNFEYDTNADGTPDGWTRAGTGGSPTVTLDATEAQTGTYAVKVDNTLVGGSNWRLYQTGIPVTPGLSHTLRVKAKVPTGVTLQLRVGDNSSNSDDTYKLTTITGDDTWRTVRVGLIPTGSLANLSFYVVAATAAAFWLDAASLEAGILAPQAFTPRALTENGGIVLGGVDLRGVLTGTVANTPAGGVAATTVQGAINELDTEKAPLTGATFTGAIAATVVSAGTTPANSGIVRIPNNQNISARNAADNGDIPLLILGTDNNTSLKATSGGRINYVVGATTVFSSSGTTIDTNVTITAGAGLTMPNGQNMVCSTGASGNKFGTATNQKIGFWNATPIVQPTTAGAAATFVANTSLIANDTATFDGYTIGQVVKALRNAGLLA